MKEHTKAYMAGLMDAEGCFTIARNVSPLGNPHYEPCLNLTNNHKGLADWLVTNFGGVCRWKKVYASNKEPWYQWKFSSYQHATKFLSLVMPYLVIKQEEAKILGDFYSLYRQEVPNLRESLCTQIKSLKNRVSLTTDTPTLLWPNNLANAYFAGFFDGEGTVSIGAGLKPRLRLSLSNTSEPILLAMQKRYQGAVYSRGKRQPHHQAIWAWQLDKTRYQEQFLLNTLPHLIIKRPKALESLERIRNKKIQSELTGNRERDLARTQDS